MKLNKSNKKMFEDKEFQKMMSSGKALMKLAEDEKEKREQRLFSKGVNINSSNSWKSGVANFLLHLLGSIPNVLPSVSQQTTSIAVNSTSNILSDNLLHTSVTNNKNFYAVNDSYVGDKLIHSRVRRNKVSRSNNKIVDLREENNFNLSQIYCLNIVQHGNITFVPYYDEDTEKLRCAVESNNSKAVRTFQVSDNPIRFFHHSPEVKVVERENKAFLVTAFIEENEEKDNVEYISLKIHKIDYNASNDVVLQQVDKLELHSQNKIRKEENYQYPITLFEQDNRVLVISRLDDDGQKAYVVWNIDYKEGNFAVKPFHAYTSNSARLFEARVPYKLNYDQLVANYFNDELNIVYVDNYYYESDSAHVSEIFKDKIKGDYFNGEIPFEEDGCFINEECRIHMNEMVERKADSYILFPKLIRIANYEAEVLSYVEGDINTDTNPNTLKMKIFFGDSKKSIDYYIANVEDDIDLLLLNYNTNSHKIIITTVNKSHKTSYVISADEVFENKDYISSDNNEGIFLNADIYRTESQNIRSLFDILSLEKEKTYTTGMTSYTTSDEKNVVSTPNGTTKIDQIISKMTSSNTKASTSGSTSGMASESLGSTQTLSSSTETSRLTDTAKTSTLSSASKIISTLTTNTEPLSSSSIGGKGITEISKMTSSNTKVSTLGSTSGMTSESVGSTQITISSSVEGEVTARLTEETTKASTLSGTSEVMPKLLSSTQLLSSSSSNGERNTLKFIDTTKISASSNIVDKSTLYKEDLTMPVTAKPATSPNGNFASIGKIVALAASGIFLVVLGIICVIKCKKRSSSNGSMINGTSSRSSLSDEIVFDSSQNNANWANFPEGFYRLSNNHLTDSENGSQHSIGGTSSESGEVIYDRNNFVFSENASDCAGKSNLPLSELNVGSLRSGSFSKRVDASSIV